MEIPLVPTAELGICSDREVPIASVEQTPLSADALTPRELLLVDAFAERVCELLRGMPPRAQLVVAATVADALSVSRDTVYARAEQLGCRRIGDGPRARLRFDLDY